MVNGQNLLSNKFTSTTMKVAITGSSGHLGEALCRTFQEKGIAYIGIDIKPSNYTTHVGSITDKGFLNEVIQGVDYILHTATLHKPHVATHSKEAFIAVNISGTLNLLEEAKAKAVKGFIFTSTTSVFGDLLRPPAGTPAVWVTEEMTYLAKNIYGLTKNAAEDLCRLFYRNHKLPCIILRTSRFFWEEDDNKDVRDTYIDVNIKINEYSHRRVDVEDIVYAHLLAMEKVAEIGFNKYIISATPPFQKEDLALLNTNAPSVIKRIYPEVEAIYQERNWKLFPQIGRVYVNEKARRELGWEPKYNYDYILNCLQEGQPFKSALTQSIGIKRYHKTIFKDGPYPVNE